MRKRGTSGFGRPVRTQGPSYNSGAKAISIVKVLPTPQQRMLEKWTQYYVKELCPETFQAFRRRNARKTGRQVTGVDKGKVQHARELARKRIEGS